MAELRLIEAICEALHEEMARDDDVVLLGEDVGVKGGVFGASKGLLEAFGPTARARHARVGDRHRRARRSAQR